MAKRGGARRSWVRWLVGIVAALIVLLVAIVVLAPMLIPVDTIRDKITSAVRDATGRELNINGGLSLSVFPTLAVEAKNVAFANASWAPSSPMVSLARLDAKLRLLPLLSGNVQVESFVLEKPEIDLETDKSGHGNWEFARAPARPAAPEPTPGQAAAPGPPSGSGGGGTWISEIALSDVRITDGHVTYRDGVSGKTETADAINLKVSLPNLDSALALDGSVTWHDKPVQLAVDAAKPRDLVGGSGTQFGIKLAADPIKLAFAGTMALAGAPKGSGDLDLSIPSVRALALWATGQKLDLPGDGLALLALKGKVTVDGAKYGLAGVQLALDAAKYSGDFTIDIGGARPSLKGQLAVDRLDLNHYMAPAPDNKAAPAQAAPAKPAAGAVTPAGASAGWSDELIDASGLKSADVTLALAADAILWRKVEIGKTAVQIALQGGRLTLDLTNMALYQGTVKGRVGVDASGAQLVTDANLTVDKVQVQPLLVAFAGTDRVSGAAVASTQLSSKGKSQRELIGALGGKGQLALVNGVVKGIDLVGMVKNAAAKVVGGSGGDTAFTTASGSYTIASGILKNGDLTVAAPTLSATGAGTVDLPKQTVDYKLQAQLAGALAVPVDVKGPWSDISWNVDLAGMVKQNLGNAGKLLGKGAGGVGGLVGGAASGLGGLGKKLLGN